MSFSSPRFIIVFVLAWAWVVLNHKFWGSLSIARLRLAFSVIYAPTADCDIWNLAGIFLTNETGGVEGVGQQMWLVTYVHVSGSILKLYRYTSRIYGTMGK